MSLKDEFNFYDELDDAGEASELIRVERKLARLQKTSDDRGREIKRLRRVEEVQGQKITELQAVLDFQNQITETKIVSPKWVVPKNLSKKNAIHVGVPCLLLSDLHFDEVVDPTELHGWNAYNRDIAEKRLERVVNSTVDLTKSYISGVKYEGLVLMLGGDIFTGDIHEELAKTNEAPPTDSVVHWTKKMISAIEYLVDEFGQIFIPCVVGNHDRYSLKKPMKKRAREAFTWIMYNWMADYFKNDDRVTFEVSPSQDCSFNVYDTRFLLTHGDQFNGGSGIAGIFPGIMRGHYKKHLRNSSLDMPFDYMVMGHFHQLLFGPNLIVNGALKGYDEYAYDNNFNYEPPQQAFWIVTPERGITMHYPIFAEAENEGWRNVKRRR